MQRERTNFRGVLVPSGKNSAPTRASMIHLYFVYLGLPDEDHRGAGEDDGQVVDLSVGLIIIRGLATCYQLLLSLGWHEGSVRSTGSSLVRSMQKLGVPMAALGPHSNSSEGRSNKLHAAWREQRLTCSSVE